MIKKNEAKKITDAYYEIERGLGENKDMFLTKEEIYAQFPRDDMDVPYITISSMQNALRNLAHMRHIEVVYVRGVCHYGATER